MSLSYDACFSGILIVEIMMHQFQRFDQEWDEYIDIDDDYVVTEKDRLKAVVAVSHHDFDLKQNIGVGSVIFHPLLCVASLMPSEYKSELISQVY